MNKYSKADRDDKVIIENIEIGIHGKLIKTARLVNEWYEDVTDPESFVKALKRANVKADIFSFWQRLPQTTPQYSYHMEWDPIAAISVKGFDYWWHQQIDAKTRNLIRKAEKKGVKIKIVDYDDDVIKGMTEIFNETPIRQGKPFWHFGKNFETVKREFSKNIHREDIIGAYYNNELIGFVMLAHAGPYSMMTQIISKIAHRDKSPTNALIAKAVDICEKKKISYLVYAKWPSSSLGDFKRHNGFEKIDLPRYYIPLSIIGHATIKMGLHLGMVDILPERAKLLLMDFRTKWYLRKFKTVSNSLKGNKNN